MSNRHRQPNLSTQDFQRILLIKPSSLGDVIHALPVLHGLRKRYPTARIDWLIAKSIAPILEGHPGISNLIEFDRAELGKIGSSLTAVKKLTSLLRQLKTASYDLVVDLQGLFRSGFLSWASRSPVRLGFANAREGAWAFYTHRIEVPDPDAHAVDRYYLTSEVLGFEDIPVTFDLALPRPTIEKTHELFHESEVAGKGPIVVMVPGARWDTKRWLPERFAKTVDLLQASIDAQCVLVGSPDEAMLCDQIAYLCDSAPLNLAGRTNMPQMAGVIACADAVVCHDSAAAHFAAAFDRPMACLVGPTNPARTGPYKRLDDVLRKDLNCSPCYLRRLTQCPHEHRCMVELSPNEVALAVERAIGEFSPNAH